MRPIEVSVSPTQLLSPWVPTDFVQISFGIGLFVSLSEDAAGANFTIFHTPDDIGLEGQKVISISRVGTVATVTFLQPHKLVATAGDTLIVVSSGSSVLDSQLDVGGRYLPWLVATTPTPLTLTYTVANAGPLTDSGSARASCQRVFPHASIAGQTSRQDGNYAFPVRAVMLRASALTTGNVYLDILQGLGR